jgi:hypothetical protein
MLIRDAPGGWAVGERQGSAGRRRPLVAEEVVRRWVREQGLREPDGPIDDLIIELYLAKDSAGARSPSLHSSEPDDAATVIDLREELAPLAGNAVLPDRCPECGGVSYLDRIHVEQQLKSQHCKSCGHRWVSDVNPSRP